MIEHMKWLWGEGWAGRGLVIVLGTGITLTVLSLGLMVILAVVSSG